MRFTNEMREKISQDSKGKVVESMAWEPVERYWVMTFTDGSEISVLLMAEQPDLKTAADDADDEMSYGEPFHGFNLNGKLNTASWPVSKEPLKQG